MQRPRKTSHLFVEAVGAVQLLGSGAVLADLLVTDQTQPVVVVLSKREEDKGPGCHSQSNWFLHTCQLDQDLFECAHNRSLTSSPDSTETALSPPAAQLIYCSSEPMKHIIGLLNSPEQQSGQDCGPCQRSKRITCAAARSSVPLSSHPVLDHELSR